MQSLTLYADEAISTANRIIKAAAAGHCALCGASDTPIGVTSSVPGPSGLVSGSALSDGVFRIQTASAVAAFADVQLAADGYCETYNGGTRIGRAVSDTDQNGVVSVAVSLAALMPPGPIQDRDAADTYPDGVLVMDDSGIYRGDGATAGGLILDANGTATPTTAGAVKGARYKQLNTDGELVAEFNWTGTAWE